MVARLLPLLSALAVSSAAAAENVYLSRMTPGYTYFSRPGATLASHDSDVAECASTAAGIKAEEERGTQHERSGVLGSLIENWIVKAAHRGVVAAALENCMVVRGWRVVSVDDATGKQWAAMQPLDLRRALAAEVGSLRPLGRIVRAWNNDAARASSSRFELRPPTNGIQLSLRALPDSAQMAGLEVARLRSASAAPQSWGQMRREVPPGSWDSLPANRALVIVRMRGVGPTNGVSLFFQRVPNGADDGKNAGFVLFQHGLAGNRKQGRFYAFSVEPGLWRLAYIHSLDLCLGAPAFEARPGEVVYGGSFDLSSEAIGPDMDMTEVRTFLGGHSVAARIKPAVYRNGVVHKPCSGGGSIYALEIPGAPFEPGYKWGSRAAMADAQ